MIDMRYSTGAIILFFLSIDLFAQSGEYRMGARPMSLGYASAALSDEWAGFNNIGAQAGSVQNANIGFSYQSLYSIRNFGKKAATAVLPYHRFCGSLNVFSFGDEYYNETRLGLGLSHKIKFVSLGIQLNYLQVVLEQAGTKGLFFLEAGGVAELLKGLKIGAVIHNFNPAISKSRQVLQFPSQMELALSYNPQDFILIVLEVDKNMLSGSVLRAGMEYVIQKKLFLRTGISMDPAVNYFGIGFKPGVFNIDYAISWQNYLGMNHQISLSLKLHRKKNG